MNSLFIAWNLVRRTIDTKKGLLVGLLVPTIIAFVIGVIDNGGYGSVTIGYINHDQSFYSEHLIKELERKDKYKLVELESEQKAGDGVADYKYDTAFIIPENFSTTLMNGEQPVIKQISIAVSEPTITLEMALNAVTQSIVNTINLAQTLDIQDTAQVEAMLIQQQAHQISGDSVKWHERAGTYLSTMIGFMLMFLMIIINQSVTSIVEDRRNQTMMRVFAAPVNSVHIAVGNFLGSLMLGTMQLVTIMVMSRYVFQFDYGVSFWNQFIVMECFILAALGISSAVGGLVRNADQLGMINSLVMTPTCMIGGCFWPISFMPEFMQKIANFVPQKWAIEAMTLLSQGETIADVTIHLGILLLFAAVLLGFGVTVLRPSEANSH